MRFSQFSLPLLALTLATLGCHAQTPAAKQAAASAQVSVQGQALTPAEQHRVEVLLRQKANLPPGSIVNIGPRKPSDVPGYDSISVSFSAEGKSSQPVNFLISKDGKTLAQFSKFNISANPRDLVSDVGRPSRGGPANAPVLIVGFDDLECPYCARLHESLFPALTKRYGDEVRFVYKDFPIPQHPWAMHAAVDVNCLAAQSPQGYWDLVDYIHGHASEIGADATDAKAAKTLPRAEQQLDKETREQGKAHKVDMPKLEACITKQDTDAINSSMAVGDSLGIDSTPTLFVNGEKLEGAVPLEFLFGQIDDSLRAAGVQPPPPYIAPAAVPEVSSTASPKTVEKK